MEKWKTVDTVYLYRTPFGNLRKDTCKLPNGHTIDAYYVQEYADWVNAIVLTKEHQVVLVEQYRHAGGEFYLEVPAGKLEAGESDKEGLLREVKEETGYTSDTAPVKLGALMVNPATQTNQVITYLITDAYLASEQNLDDNEEIKVHLLDFHELGTAIKENRMKTQLFTAYAYYLARDFLADTLGRGKTAGEL